MGTHPPTGSAYSFLSCMAFQLVRFSCLYALGPSLTVDFAVLHIGEAAITRSWFIYPTAVLAGILELLGWGARYASSGNVHLKWAFQMQITCTIIGLQIHRLSVT